MKESWYSPRRWKENSPERRSQNQEEEDAEKPWSREDRRTKPRGKDTSWRGVRDRVHGPLVREFDPKDLCFGGRMSHDYHSYPVEKRMKRWSPTEHFPTGLEPFELSDEIGFILRRGKSERIALFWPVQNSSREHRKVSGGFVS